MKLNFELSSIIGANYQNGNVVFTPDSKSILSPVGNNVSILQLTTDEIKTFEVNSNFNIEHIIVSPKSPIMICINEKGYANIVSMITGCVINYHNFRNQISCAKFSPNGRYFAVGRGRIVMVYHSPSLDKPLTQLKLQRVYDGANADIKSIDWTCDSRAFVAGSADSSTRVYAAFGTKKLVLYSLGGNNDEVIKSSFMSNSLDVMSVSKNGQLCHWVCNKSLAFLSDKDDIVLEETKKNKNVVTYLKPKIHFYRNIENDHQLGVEVSAADFSRHLNLLVTGFVSGKIMIHELPEFNPKQYFDISTGVISTICFDGIGTLIAIGCSEHNQLDVWNWRSQTVSFRSKGHTRSAINCLDYSPDGGCLATGGHDGAVKLWMVASGRCSATFSDHSAPVTGVCFPLKKRETVFSSSLDGSVHGHDLVRKKVFCKLTPGENAYQLTCVSTDETGQMVAAGGGSDCFSVLVWEVKTKKLVYTLSGHDQPVCGVQFASAMSYGHLLSGSWDKTMRVWSLIEGATKEVFQTNSDVLTVAYRPDGRQVAGSLLNGNIIFFDPMTGEQVAEIEAKHDLGISKHEGELITAKKASEEKIIQALCYSADGELVLAAGNTKYICVYSVAQQLLLRRFTITCNQSLEGVLETHDRRRITDWGFSDVHINMSEQRALPGVTKDNNTLRSVTIEASVSSIRFSPTGTTFAASSTEGVLVYSTETVFRGLRHLGGRADFSQYTVAVTPDSVRERMACGQRCSAVDGALRLKRMDLLLEVIEAVPITEAAFVVGQLCRAEVGLALVRLLARMVRVSARKAFYLGWARAALSAWAEDCWQDGGDAGEWAGALVEMIKAVRACRERLVGGDIALHKADWAAAMVAKEVV